MADVLVSVPEDFLRQMDKVAGNENITRSELIKEALRTYLHRNTNVHTQKTSRSAEILEALFV